jgi:alkanesulfonate monooxygenase SsuD/methylene tetrahydromethanopterin reductase-like flavin-dependent oxidoreductase (luciferase family)
VFTEMSYPFTPPSDSYESVRVTLPNRYYDPEVGHTLYKTYFDILVEADRLGLDIMVNEHHSTATSVTPAVPLSLSILARETKHARLLALGNPLGNRPDPVRVAEEMALVDVISGGRLEVGFVVGVPMEISAVNVSPVDQRARFWEAVELIQKTWTSHDGPFSWEGDFFQHRQVNIWPRPFQKEIPQWTTALSPRSAAEAAEKGFSLGTLLNGTEGASKVFGAYRARAAELSSEPVPDERLGYLGLVAVAETDKEGMEAAEKLLWYPRENKVADQFKNVPGYIPSEVRASLLQYTLDGVDVPDPWAHFKDNSMEELVEAGYIFAGTPETVYQQIKDFNSSVGGFGNLIMMPQAGPTGFEMAQRTMELYSTQVLPRLREDALARTESA